MIAIKSLLMPCLVLTSASAAAAGYYGYEYFSSVDKPETRDQNLQDAQSSTSRDNPAAPSHSTEPSESGLGGSQPETPPAPVQTVNTPSGGQNPVVVLAAAPEASADSTGNPSTNPSGEQEQAK